MDAAGDFLVAWTSFVPYCYDTAGMVCPPHGDIYARRFNAAGRALGAEFRVNTTPVPNTTPAVAMEADGDFVVAWDSNSPAADGIYARRYGNTPAPRVADVFVGSIGWKPGFYRYLAEHGQGEAVFGYALPKGAGQFGVLPCSFLNQVSIRFSGPVIALQRHLSLVGFGAGGPVVGDFAYNPATNTGIWTFDRPLPPGPLTLRLDAGEDGVSGAGAAGLRLDGEWSDAESWVSGDGEPGGDLLFRVNVLPGDATRDGRVNALDLGFIKQRLNRTWANPGSGTGAYSPFADLDGSGSINASDLGWVKWWLNTRTPVATSAATTLLFSTTAISR
jgi:hypothetical protein